MSGEMEVVGAASIGGVTSKQKADLTGKPCLNCGCLVEERYCTECGQLAASFHRPIWSLVGETITDTLALDGRLARTMPKLFFRPGALTKAYISGQRARYVPPFRLFLLASLVFYFVLFAIIGNASWMEDWNIGASENSPAAIVIERAPQPLNPEAEGEAPDTQAPDTEPWEALDDGKLIGPDGKIDRDYVRNSLSDEEGAAIDDDMIDRAADAFDNPRLFLLGLEKWVPRLSFLLVPSTILSLTILHFWRRKIYVYDHAIHALHLHTWMYLAGALAMGAGLYIGGWTGLIFLVAMIAYVWRSLAVVGETGMWMSLWRLLNMLIAWFFVALTLAVSSVVLGAIAL